jgi:hypothetical protein
LSKTNKKEKDMHQDILNKLYGKFNLSERRGQGNQMFKYIPNEEVIHRMNTVFAGNWSSEVLFTERVDDQIVLRVRIMITDPETNRVYYHEGYGSHQIARYTAGQNEGKIIDIGNSYKSAFSKAIVNASMKWGVGLFKEKDVLIDDVVEEDYTPAPTPPAPAPPTMPTPAPAPPKPVATPTAAPAVAMPAAPTQMVAPQRPALPSAASLPDRPMIPLRPSSMGNGAMVQSTTSVPPPRTIPAAPMAQKPILSTPKPAVAIAVPVAPITATPPPPQDLPFSATLPEPVSRLNDVQKVAINGILTLRKMTYDQLASEAFADAGQPGYKYPPTDQLTYDEAVIVIKYGNNKFRKH